MSGNNISYGKYDKGGISPKAPTTKKPETMPGTHGTKKGALTKALGRGKKIDKMMGYK